MLDLLLAGGWLMVPLIICSVLSLAIIIERTVKLKYKKIIPDKLTENVVTDLKCKALSNKKLDSVQNSSPLGSLLVLIIKNISVERELMLSHLEDQGRKIVHELEKNLNLLGTIATIAPLLGLLGTVVGMIDVFSVITEQGVGNPNTLAGGISQALITTAVGLSVAIPCFIFYRSFQRKIDELSYGLEHEAMDFYEQILTYLKELRAEESAKSRAKQTTNAYSGELELNS
jgi:biopolymer transport protein ExbB